MLLLVSCTKEENITLDVGVKEPTVTTLSATSVTSSEAILNGSVNTNGLRTNIWFEYGTFSTLNNHIGTFVQIIESGISPIEIQQTISGLEPSTQYYYRISAANSEGTVRGSVLSFETANDNIGNIHDSELTIYSSQDVYVSSALPEKNFDYQNDEKYGIGLKLAPEGSYDGEYRIYIHFDLSQIPQDVTIDEAYIRLTNLAGGTNNSDTKAVCGILMLNKSNFPYTSTNWNENSLTWKTAINQAVNNVNNSGWLFYVDGESSNLEKSVKLDIQAYVNNTKSIVENYNGWVIRSYGNTAENKYTEHKTFYSSEFNSSVKPLLYVKYH